MKPSDPREHNRSAWNRMARQGHRFARPAREQDFMDPLGSVDAPGWLGPDIRGQRVLCLAAGGGRQGPIYAAAGARVTVVDISDSMLELDRQVARDRKQDIRVVQSSMDDLSPLDSASFDIVIQPVSTCYVPDIGPVYDEVARVLVAGGLYISQHKQPTSLQVGEDSSRGYSLQIPYDSRDALPVTDHPSLIREPGVYEYIHRWQDLLGSMCQAGFVIEDLLEPQHGEDGAARGSFGHRCRYVAPYVRIKARRTEASVRQTELWTP